MNLHRRPLFPIAVAYIAGIVCATEIHLSAVASIWLGLVAPLLAIAVPSARLPRSMLVLAGVVFSVGLFRTAAVRVVPFDDISRHAEGKLVYLTGTIASDPEPREDGSVRFVLRSESVKTYTGEYHVGGQVMVSVYRPKWHHDDIATAYVPFHGDRVRLHGRLRIPGPAANPGSNSYADYLARRRIYCAISAQTGAIEHLGPGAGRLRRMTARFKHVLTAAIHEHFPDERGNLLLGILLGNYAALPLSVQSAFMRTGTMHLLAASGYNCGVIILIFRWVLQRLTVPRAWMHVMLILLLWGFAVLAGAGPSIVRATIMVTAFLSAYLLWRASDLLNTVLLSGLVILVANPLSLYDVGFQLSFAAVLAIILATPFMDVCIRSMVKQDDAPPAPRYGIVRGSVAWAWRNTLSAVILSVAATIGTAPITAYYFNYISIVSILANAAVALLVVALTALGLSSVVLGSVPILSVLAVTGCKWVCGWMLFTVVYLSEFAWSSYSVRSPTGAFVLFYYVVVFTALEYAHRRLSVQRKSLNGTKRKDATG